MGKSIERADVSGTAVSLERRICIEDVEDVKDSQTLSVVRASNNNASEIPICHSRTS